MTGGGTQEDYRGVSGRLAALRTIVDAANQNVETEEDVVDGQHAAVAELRVPDSESGPESRSGPLRAVPRFETSPAPASGGPSRRSTEIPGPRRGDPRESLPVGRADESRRESRRPLTAASVIAGSCHIFREHRDIAETYSGTRERAELTSAIP